MHFCVPVVAMPVGDLPRLLQHGFGVVAKSVEATSFSDAITKSIRDHMPWQTINPRHVGFTVTDAVKMFAQQGLRTS